MKRFVFHLNSKKASSMEDNGWVFKFQSTKNLGCFFLKSPVMKKTNYSSQSPPVSYLTHTVLGLGYIDKLSFKGLAFFDLHSRVPVVFAILIGVGYASGKIHMGAFWAVMFYLLITYLSSKDDAYMLHKAKTMCD